MKNREKWHTTIVNFMYFYDVYVALFMEQETSLHIWKPPFHQGHILIQLDLGSRVVFIHLLIIKWGLDYFWKIMDNLFTTQ